MENKTEKELLSLLQKYHHYLYMKAGFLTWLKSYYVGMDLGGFMEWLKSRQD